jgi:flagellar motor switch protein FliG
MMRWVGPVAVMMAVLCGAAAVPSQASGQQIRPGPVMKRKAAVRRQQMIEKFSQMPPEERERVLKTLPEERRKQVQENLDRYRELTPEQKQRLSRQFENFRDLPPEKQQSVRRLFREMNQMPVERRAAIRREVARLREADGDERKDRMNSEAFKEAYSAEEQRVIRELAGLLPAGE